MTLAEANQVCRSEYIVEVFQKLCNIYLSLKDSLGEDEALRLFNGAKDNLMNKLVEGRVNGFVSLTDFQQLVSAYAHWDEATKKFLGVSLEPLANGQEPREDFSPRNGRTPEDYAKEYALDCVTVPDNIDSLPLLAPQKAFVAPGTIDLRDYCVSTKDQGRMPWCAAYAAVGFASNILWRKSDFPTDFDPGRIYGYAKKVDNSSSVNGTSLMAVLEGLLHFDMFDSKKCSIKVLRNVEQVKYAVHKFGCCLAGLNISKEWYSCNGNKSTISGRKDTSLIGGHAVLVCGYNRDGVIIQNSWGSDWGSYGFALITWKEFERQFIYGAVLDNCLYDTRIN